MSNNGVEIIESTVISLDKFKPLAHVYIGQAAQTEGMYKDQDFSIAVELSDGSTANIILTSAFVVGGRDVEEVVNLNIYRANLITQYRKIDEAFKRVAEENVVVPLQLSGGGLGDCTAFAYKAR